MTRLTRSEMSLCAVYTLIAAVALVATWSNNLAFLRQPENQNAMSFFRAMYANRAAASIANDLLLFALAAWLFMVMEAQRLHMRHVWVYILLSILVAVSVMFPLFLVGRQFAIARRRSQAGVPER